MTRVFRQNVAFGLDTPKFKRGGFEVILMASMQADVATMRIARPEGVIDWRAAPSVSDDECLALLAKAVANHDPEALDEVAWLIGRLAVPIE
jgi:hypothetical protein